jgi:outer membrane protein assembly factor BamB
MGKTELYDPASDTWTIQKQGLNKLWMGSSAVLYDHSGRKNKMFVMGGTQLPPSSSAGAGTLAWSYKTGGSISYSSPAQSPDGTVVYVGSSDNNLYAINAADGSYKWAFRTGGSVYSSPTLSPDGTVVYVGSNDHNLYAINTADGTKKWPCRTAMSTPPRPCPLTAL